MIVALWFMDTIFNTIIILFFKLFYGFFEKFNFMIQFFVDSPIKPVHPIDNASVSTKTVVVNSI